MGQTENTDSVAKDASANFIDVEGLIAKKSPKLLKMLPKWLIRYLKRIVHQDDLNGMIRRLGHLQDIEFVNACLADMGISYTAQGLENLPANGRFIFASNHPLGGLDGLILLSEMQKHFPDIKFVVNDLLMNLDQLSGLFVPVNKHGGQNIDYVRRIENTYASTAQVLYFPAGLCSRRIGTAIMDLEWKKSFVSKAIKHQRDIVPIFFEGRNSNFFYNLARVRKFFGIKANIEMLYLVDEMFRQKGKAINLIVGEPIPYTTFTKEKTPQDWALFIRKKAYALKNSGKKQQRFNDGV
ncbi:1-acyl-sn-glycerol-3-phosphate acyltransferase [Williamwhitmania taraxaci]|uniref:Acyltransferase n=1 Tax=Williamwhitmania taraxaci TaxID=1640674 RepID=A0A1G6L7R9_9BACT|nr:1-acyl-sn-glycerol-3-phosphate acyltransferase [Williamwhitmania taraxaci]SDC39168.1 Acyltransferase [Williamwhitmania taraxaci]